MAKPPALPALPKGPFDPKDPLPWDPYTYPDTVPSVVSQSYVEYVERLKKLKKAIDLWKKIKPGDDDDQKKLPGPLPPERRLPSPEVPDDRRLPGGPLPPERQLPAGFSSVAEVFDNPEAAGLFGPTPLEEYDAYLKRNGIRHFSAKELTGHRWRHANGRIAPGDSSAHAILYEIFPPDFHPDGFHHLLAKYVVPPPELWPNIIPMLRILDRFREWLGAPVVGISGYRCPWYNRQIDGSETSYHMKNGAIDFTYGARKHGHLDYGLWLGFFETLYRQRGDGVGLYESNFIHADVGWDRHKRADKGLNWHKPDGWHPPK